MHMCLRNPAKWHFLAIDVICTCVQANVLKDKLREKESELTSVFEACEAEKSAYDAARASANERYQGELERKTELESTVRELSVMVEQLKEVCASEALS